MMKRESVITINGQHYSATTGERIDSVENFATENSRKSAEKSSESSRKSARKKQNYAQFFDDIAEESQKKAAKKSSRKTERTAEIRENSEENSSRKNEKSVSAKPKKPRLTKAQKQALIAQEIAEDISEFEPEKNENSAKKAEKSRENPPKSAEKIREKREENYAEKFQFRTKSKSASPKWIANFAAGNAPLAIEPSERKFHAENAKISRKIIHPTAENIRRETQKSTTLNRRYVHAPKATKIVAAPKIIRAKAPLSPLVSHFAENNFEKNFAKTSHENREKTEKNEKTFAKNPENFQIPVRQKAPNKFANSSSSRTRETEAPYQNHALESVAKTKIARAYDNLLAKSSDEAAQDFANFAAKNARRAKIRETRDNSDSKILKNALIREQLDAPIMKNLSEKDRKKAEKLQRKIAKNEQPRRHFRASTLATAMVAVLLAGGYLAYVNMPNISLRVAAVQAGVNAKSPFTPNGYSASGDIAYEPGQLTVNYKNNGGGDGYSLTQSNTSLDADSVRENVIQGDDYRTFLSGDTTVYKYGDTAVWVANGTLFTLNGNKYLTDKQIEQIANSVES